MRELILSGDERVHRPEFAQPALFAVGYALARTLTSLGVTPAAVLGHSLGEYAAAVTAGALELGEAARLVVRRGALMSELPRGGGMTAVVVNPGELAEVLAREPAVVAAALNGPTDTVLSGPLDALARIAKELGLRGVKTTSLPVAHAFHSPLLGPAAADLRTMPVRCAAPVLPLASTRYGRMLRHEPMDADYWADQIEEPVLMDTALGALVSDIAPTHLIEIGPRSQLLEIMRPGRARHRGGVPASGPRRGRDRPRARRDGRRPPPVRAGPAVGGAVRARTPRGGSPRPVRVLRRPPLLGPAGPGPGSRARAGGRAGAPMRPRHPTATTTRSSWPSSRPSARWAATPGNASYAKPASTRTSASTR